MANQQKFIIDKGIIGQKAAQSPAYAAEKLLEFASQLRDGKVDEALSDWVATAIEKSISIEDAKQNKAKDRTNASELGKALGLTAPIKRGHRRSKVDPIEAGREMAKLMKEKGISKNAARIETQNRLGISKNTMLAYYDQYEAEYKKQREDFVSLINRLKQEMSKPTITPEFLDNLRKQLENMPE